MPDPSEPSATDKFFLINGKEFELLDQMNLLRPFVDEGIRELPLAILKGLYRDTFYHQMFSKSVARFSLQVLIKELDQAESGNTFSLGSVLGFAKCYSREEPSYAVLFGEAEFLIMDKLVAYVKFESKNKDLLDLIANHLHFQSEGGKEAAQGFLEGAKIFELCLSYQHRLGMSWKNRVTPEGEKIQSGEFSNYIYGEGVWPFFKYMGFDDGFGVYKGQIEGVEALTEYIDGAIPWESSMDSQ